jgi:ABC-type branched-subunit amino acid transport system ATPase component
MTSAINRLEYRDLYMHFDGLVVFRDVTFGVPAGTITALIGPNGAGKSTLINMTCGVFPPAGGTISKDGRDLAGLGASRALASSLVRTFQNVRVFPTLSVIENVLVAFPDQPGDDPLRIFGRAAKRVEERNRELAAQLLERVGLANDAGRRADEIPFGSQKLLALVRATATGANTLLLDETTTGLEISRVPLVLDFLRSLRAEGRTILLVEHNMDVVTGVADSVVVLHGTVIAQGTPQQVLHDEHVIRDYLGRIYSA